MGLGMIDHISARQVRSLRAFPGDTTRTTRGRRFCIVNAREFLNSREPKMPRGEDEDHKNGKTPKSSSFRHCYPAGIVERVLAQWKNYGVS
jgi:hypothetical protein